MNEWSSWGQTEHNSDLKPIYLILTCMLIRISKSVLVIGRPPSSQWRRWMSWASSVSSSWQRASSDTKKVTKVFRQTTQTSYFLFQISQYIHILCHLSAINKGTIGGGINVLGLLQPGRHLAVHPSLSGGSESWASVLLLVQWCRTGIF